MDKTVAKKSDSILFVKIENDGFDLGAQRRIIEKNDLPFAVNTIEKFKEAIQNGKQFIPPDKSLIVSKEKLKTNSNYSLSLESYALYETNKTSFDIVKLSTICKNLDFKRRPVTASDRIKGRFPYYGASGIVDYVDDFIFDDEYLLVSEDGANLKARVTPIAFSVSGKIWVNNHAHILKFMDRATQKFVECYLNSISLEKYITGSAQPKLNQESLNSIQIPLPPLSIQQEIVSKIENYQRIIDGAKQVVEAYKPQIDINPDWEMVELKGLCEKILSGGTPSTENSSFWNGTIPWISSADIIDIKTATPRRFINEIAIQNSATNLIPKGNVIVVTRVSLGKLFLNDFDVCISQDSQGLVLNKALVKPEYALYVLLEKVQHFKNSSQGTTIQGVTKQQLSSIQIPLPSIEEQERIIQQIENVQQLVNANKELITIYGQKIKDEIAKLWQEDKKETIETKETLVVEVTL